MRNWIVTGLVGLTMSTTACTQIVERLAVTQLQYGLEGVELKRADVPLFAQNPSADLQINLRATNPNTVTATLDQLGFDLFLEGTKVGTGSLASKLSVPANGSQSVGVLVTVPYTGLPTAAMNALLARRANLTLRGTSGISTPIGNIPVPIEIQQTVSF